MKPPKPKRYEDMNGAERVLARVVVKWMSRVNTALFRLTKGRVGGRFLGGERVLLLTTRGKKSGKERIVPLLYLEDGSNLVVVASKGGWPEHPLWYGNLVADPKVEVQIGARREPRRARTATDAEHDALWPRLCDLYPSYQDYQNVTDRKIPVVILEPSAA
jgi:F420H(2)-dependent quinone reductase